MLTFGGGLIGLGAIVIAPVGIMAGVLMGRKVVKTERERVLLTSRQQAKQALRKYVDEVLFQVAKESRDSLRDVQKELRDLFTARATELTRSTKEAVASTQQALTTDTAAKKSRVQELTSTIDQIHDVQRLCGEILVEVGA
jgi:Skp family chaperone for outer membrane proteins